LVLIPSTRDPTTLSCDPKWTLIPINREEKGTLILFKKRKRNTDDIPINRDHESKDQCWSVWWVSSGAPRGVRLLPIRMKEPYNPIGRSSWRSP